MAINADIQITGLSPFLMNNVAAMMESDNGSGVSSRKKKYDDNHEAEIREYRTDKGQLYIPAVAFRLSLIGVGGGAKNKKNGKMSARNCVCAGVFEREQQCVVFSATTGKPIKKYDINKMPVIVNKARVMRCRPEITNWRCLLKLEVDEEFITVDQLIELLNIAGKIAGVMDFRPQCTGSYGRYTAALAA